MTDEQKQSVTNHRAMGLSYSQIANEVGLPLNTVKSFCRRAGLSESNASEDTGIKNYEENIDTDNKDICKNCGKTLIHKEKVNRRDSAAKPAAAPTGIPTENR